MRERVDEKDTCLVKVLDPALVAYDRRGFYDISYLSLLWQAGMPGRIRGRSDLGRDPDRDENGFFVHKRQVVRNDFSSAAGKENLILFGSPQIKEKTRCFMKCR